MTIEDNVKDGGYEFPPYYTKDKQMNEIKSVKISGQGYAVDYGDGVIWSVSVDGCGYDKVKIWLAEGNTPEPEFTDEELAQQLEDAKPKIVTMRQARLALLQSGLLQTVQDAIANGTDEAMKIEWEYATEVKRDWGSLVTLTTTLGMTSQELDNLFQLASTL